MTNRSRIAGICGVVMSVLLAAGCGGGRTLSSGTTGGVTVKSVTPSVASELDRAFQAWEKLPATCPVVEIPGTSRLATIDATGVSWATAQFAPAPGCQVFRAPVSGSTSNQFTPVDPRQFGPFSTTVPPRGVFEQPSSAPWQMNDEGGSPFPCPAPGGAAPGLDNGSIPKDVLQAWGLSYASHCELVNYPRAPG